MTFKRHRPKLRTRRLEADIHPNCWYTLSKVRKLLEQEWDVEWVSMDEALEYLFIHSERAASLLREVTERWDEIELDPEYKWK